jgi:hypothetical protein
LQGWNGKNRVDDFQSSSVLEGKIHTMFLNEFGGNFNNLFISFIVCYNYGLAISLQFFPTAEESIDYYNQKRCFDGKGLVLPSQIVSLSFLCDNFLSP